MNMLIICAKRQIKNSMHLLVLQLLWMLTKRKVSWRLFFSRNLSTVLWYGLFYSRELNNKINRIHERALRIRYDDKLSSFEEVLIKNNSVKIHHRNVRALAIEIDKIIQGLFPSPLRVLTWDPKWNFVSPWEKVCLYYFSLGEEWNEI